MDKKNLPGFLLLLLSLGFLIPGLYMDLLSLEIAGGIPDYIVAQIPERVREMFPFDLSNIKLTIYDETRSILGTIADLFENGNGFVGFLILLFSVIVPVLKACSLFAVLFVPSLPRRRGIYKFVMAISKWSMADVFVVGVFVAFLSLKSNDKVDAEIHIGFYLFLTYCLLSILGAQLLRFNFPPKEDQT